MNGRLLFLGTGGSLGVPLIGCKCAVCASENPYNKRLRPSVLVTIQGLSPSVPDVQLLVDAGPDFRTQALRYGIDHLDGVIVTHSHNDHVAGLDDLRVYYLLRRTALPCLLSQVTYEDLRQRYAYIFTKKEHVSLVSQLDVTVLPSKEGTLHFLDREIGYLTYEQAGMEVNGFRFGDMAYISDIKHYDETIFDQLKDVRVLIVSALRYELSPLHFSIEDAITFANKVGAEQTWLTHIDHNVDHEIASKKLPTGVRLAYDGLEIQF